MPATSSSRKWIIIASGVTGFFAAVIWLGAPIIPAVLGAIGAGLLLYYRRRPRQ
jgi:Flp pilus assembly protein TadB